MTELQALWLGIVQGLTEFFPVSSSGHLVVFQALLGLRSDGDLLFEIAVHVATLVAILIYYRQRVGELIVGFFRRDAAALTYVGMLAVATLPALAAALVGKDFIERQFDDPFVTGVALLVTGGVVYTTRFTASQARLTAPTWSMALLIGCAQACAIMPGISRSGSTVAAALALGLAPAVAAEFSFLLGTIAISGAAVLMVPDLVAASAGELQAVAIGSVAALVSGLAALWLFVRMLATGTFHYFAIWAWLAGASFLIWLAQG